ncbi:XdhC family protein [Streptomyces sp. NPDC001388]|uniref:XdhC family protein n=1 Tax=unclassified Streptomyces TaxID=2593676 RepID=UPI0036B4E8A4
MLTLAADLRRWRREGREFAVATVIATRGSAPREPGAALAVDRDGQVIGSVSGGCVEGAVYDLCRQALADGAGTVAHFGYSAADALAVGLTCGGAIDVLVTPVTGGRRAEVLDTALDAADAAEPVALVRATDPAPGPSDGGLLAVSSDGSYRGSLGGTPEWEGAVAKDAAALLSAGRTGLLGPDAGSRAADGLFVETSVPPPRLIVFGATDVAAAVVRVGAFLGYRVTVCDARPVFATAARFPEADEVVVAWPHTYLARTEVDGRTALCVLTHDPKFDIPLLVEALRLPVAYVGAMGSRRTHEERVARLREEGVGEPALGRLRSPLGLHLGGRTPQETAVSVAAELIALRRGGTGVPLTGFSGPVHGPIPAAAL